jgi:hypothetical protein
VKLLVIVGFVSATMFGVQARALAQATPVDEAAIRKQMAAYEDARKRGDVWAEAAIFTPDAEIWLAASGEWNRGVTLKGAFASTADPNRRVEVEKVTFLGEGVAVVDAQYSGGTNHGHGIYIFERRGGAWLIRLGRIVRDYPAPAGR